MPRGMRLFGWAFIIAGSALLAAYLSGQIGQTRPLDGTYAVMGFFFGGLHLAYGVYLYFTEPRRKAT